MDAERKGTASVKTHEYTAEEIITYIRSKYKFSVDELADLLSQGLLDKRPIKATSDGMKKRVMAILVAWFRHTRTGYDQVTKGRGESFSDYHFKKVMFSNQARKILKKYEK